MKKEVDDLYSYERELINQGISLIAGVDEVGRGPLVGPVVAAAVILPKNYKLEGLTDSKKLSEKKRDLFYDMPKRYKSESSEFRLDYSLFEETINNIQLKSMEFILMINF